MTASSVEGDYGLGFTWDRSGDWTGQAVHGSLESNPQSDAASNPAWRYEYVRGDGLGGADPWYGKIGTPMSADTDWFNNAGIEVWAVADDVLPVVNVAALYHLANDTFDGTHGLWEDIPVVRWLNPTGEATDLTVVGELMVGWRNAGSASLPVDVAIARVNLASGDVTLMYSATVDNPIGNTLFLPISFEVPMASDDSLAITLRATNLLHGTGTYIAMFDDLSIQAAAIEPPPDAPAELIPEPATVALTALALTALGRYVRKRRKN